MNLRNRMLTIDNGDKYVVIDDIQYLNKKYLLLGKVIEEDIDENLLVAEYNDDKVTFVNNEILKEELLRLFKNK